MSNFPSNSHFDQEDERAPLRLSLPQRIASSPSPDLTAEGIGREVEGWYNELNDLVRRMGTSRSTGSHSDRHAQKRAQKGTTGVIAGVSSTELHERLTELRDQIYRFLR